MLWTDEKINDLCEPGTRLVAARAAITTLEASNEDLTCRLAQAEAVLEQASRLNAYHAAVLAAQSAIIERLTAENKQQRAFLVERLAKTWQPIETETKVPVTGDFAILIVEESGDQLMGNGLDLSVMLPDGVRMGRMVQNG